MQIQIPFFLLEQINREELSINPNAIHLLSQNINKINWAYSNAVEILEQHIDKIYWPALSANTSIFTYDEFDLHEQFYPKK